MSWNVHEFIRGFNIFEKLKIEKIKILYNPFPFLTSKICIKNILTT